ncbi:MAG TPA: hypothetical protein P5323_04035 [Candidatus Moranbacteria bacterium]|nr:hypothetical protein [Candidatus Moranbacteria bacterium]
MPLAVVASKLWLIFYINKDFVPVVEINIIKAKFTKSYKTPFIMV